MTITDFSRDLWGTARAHATQTAYQWILDDPSELQRGCWLEIYAAMDGRNVIAIGAARLVEARETGWILFTDQVRPRHFVSIHRAVMRLIDVQVASDPLILRIDPSQPDAIRWARLLDRRAHGRVKIHPAIHFSDQQAHVSSIRGE